MTSAQIDALIRENERLRAACAAARRELAAAFGDELEDEVETVAPLETLPAAWEAARAREEERLGVRIWKFFRGIRYAPA